MEPAELERIEESGRIDLDRYGGGDRLRRELPGFMQPSHYDWRDALPRNANGKLDRSALKAEIGQGHGS